MRRNDVIGLIGLLLFVAGLLFLVPSMRHQEGMFIHWLFGPLMGMMGAVLILGWALDRFLSTRRVDKMTPEEPKDGARDRVA